jgi:pimeloyl-ACP methyl ester carboxylesterase
VLHWAACGSAAHVQCTTARVPLDYDAPGGAKITLFVARSPATDPAHRIGSLFFNFGGPGGQAATYVEANGSDLLPALNRRFDIIGVDPRGVGQSTSVDCHANQERLGIYSQPFPTPRTVDLRALIHKDARYIARCAVTNSPVLLSHLSTANVVRDFDLLRRAVHDRRFTYLGFSYGTLIGSTYAAMFPHRYRALALDGPVDANSYLNHPLANLAAQSTGFEVALGRFLGACKADQVACRHFGGAHPRQALDRLIARADRHPIPAGGSDPRPVGGDDIRFAIALPLYSKFNWPVLAQALATASHGDGTVMRELTDAFYGRLPNGSYDPGTDRYFLIGATEQRYPRDPRVYLAAGARSFHEHPDFYWNNGYVELNYGLYPFRDRDAYYGPWRIPASSPTPLVVATTFDPATPYPGALNLVRELGNARLLTMRGDGHTAYGGNSTCIDTRVNAYLINLTLPPAGTVCRQQVPFGGAMTAGEAPLVRTIVARPATAAPR